LRGQLLSGWLAKAGIDGLKEGDVSSKKLNIKQKRVKGTCNSCVYFNHYIPIFLVIALLSFAKPTMLSQVEAIHNFLFCTISMGLC
jgi:hypothetical protein